MKIDYWHLQMCFQINLEQRKLEMLILLYLQGCNIMCMINVLTVCVQIFSLVYFSIECEPLFTYLKTMMIHLAMTIAVQTDNCCTHRGCKAGQKNTAPCSCISSYPWLYHILHKRCTLKSSVQSTCCGTFQCFQNKGCGINRIILAPWDCSIHEESLMFCQLYFSNFNKFRCKENILSAFRLALSILA